jgi:hypothetical protein
MPSLFERLSKALMGRGKQPPASSASIRDEVSNPSNNDPEKTPPGIEVEDAMYIESFRTIVEEGNLRLRESSEAPIELLTNYLRAINDDEKRTQRADQLLKELQGIHNFYKENMDRALVSRVMTSIQPYASEKINNGILYCRPFSTPIRKATILPELFENFADALRFEKKESGEEKKQNTATQFRR